MFNNLGEFIAVYSTIIIAITSLIGYIAKGVVQQIFDKDLEKFKTNLESETKLAQLKFDKEIESYKFSLNLIASRQNFLHSKLSEIIIELYQKLVLLHNSMLEMTARMKLVTGKNKETIEREELERNNKTGQLGAAFF